MKRQRRREDIERGARLEKARRDAGYNKAADAAAEMDTEYATYKNHEGGWRGFKRETTGRRYADFFDVNLDWLYENIGPMRGHAPRPTADPLAGLPPVARQEALDFIDYLRAKHGV